MNAFIISDADGRQVLGLDSETQLHLYRRGDRSFSLPHGLTVKILCDLPPSADIECAKTSESVQPTILSRLLALFRMKRTGAPVRPLA